MTTQYLRYWRRDKEIPEVWKIADDFGDCRHGAYAVLIIWCGQGESK